MILATIHITRHDGVRRRYALILPPLLPLLRRLFTALFGNRRHAADNKE